MLKAIPEKFCAPKMYFSSCFRLSNKDCKYFVLHSEQMCIDRYNSDIPKILNRRIGMKWGGIIGHCTGALFDVALTKGNKKINNEKCSDIKYWNETNKK